MLYFFFGAAFLAASFFTDGLGLSEDFFATFFDAAGFFAGFLIHFLAADFLGATSSAGSLAVAFLGAGFFAAFLAVFLTADFLVAAF